MAALVPLNQREQLSPFDFAKHAKASSQDLAQIAAKRIEEGLPKTCRVIGKDGHTVTVNADTNDEGFKNWTTPYKDRDGKIIREAYEVHPEDIKHVTTPTPKGMTKAEAAATARADELEKALAATNAKLDALIKAQSGKK